MSYRKASYAEGVFETYVYEKNIFGDIVAVYDLNGTKLVSYEYDAYGNFDAAYYNGGRNTPAYNNPFRYRGYYYDTDLALYYLNSRYYDAKTGRFINADEISQSTNGIILNLYCYGNPIPEGTVSIKSIETGIKPKEKILSLEYDENKNNLESFTPVMKFCPYFIDKFQIKDGHIEIEFIFWGSNVDINMYVDQAIEYITYKDPDFFGDNTIDREQLYGELLGHYLVYIATFGEHENANPANIDIYEDGSVKDPRPFINYFAEKLGKWFG